MTLRDPDIRAPLIAFLEAQGVLTISEFTTHDARADVVALTNTDLIAFEIKSDVDTAARLVRQARSYDRVATKLYLVTTPKHVAKMSQIIPPWWGLWIAYETNTGVEFREHLDARVNPMWELVTALKLLWTDEFDILMKESGLPLRSGKPKGVRAKRVATTLGDSVSKEKWLSMLHARYTAHPELRGPNKPVLSRR